MLPLFSLATALLAAVASAAPTDVQERQTSKPQQIRGVQSPIYHLYLQALPGSPEVAVMGPEATSEYFNINAGIQSTNTSMYLNIGTSSASYLPLSFSKTKNTTAWGLEGDTIITTQSSTYGRQLNFLVCANAKSGYYDLFLQKGSDVPSGKTCSNYQTIHLPCLC